MRSLLRVLRASSPSSATPLWIGLSSGLAVAVACGGDGTGTDTGPDAEGDVGTDAEATTQSESSESSGSEVTGESDASSTTDEGDLPPSCRPTLVLMGYWPPSNEMMRHFSRDTTKNPGGWVGENWRDSGWDVIAFFSEFPPDGDPTNDPIGSPGSVGSEDSDLQVDYQDTSRDFWRIVEDETPSMVLTTSRGGGIGWEIELVEGGHSGGSANDPSGDWSSDGYGSETLPTQASVDPRTWEFMSTWRAGVRVDTQLPAQAIFDATSAAGLTDVQLEGGTSGNYLSGFLGLHSAAYATTTPEVVAGGHIHIGANLDPASARMLLELSLEAMIEAHPADSVDCPR